jgi:hypothetical protein
MGEVPEKLPFEKRRCLKSHCHRLCSFGKDVVPQENGNSQRQGLSTSGKEEGEKSSGLVSSH